MRDLLLKQADVITRSQCCGDCCVLASLGYEKGKEVVYDCLWKRERMTREEKRNDLRNLVSVSHLHFLFSCYYCIITQFLLFLQACIKSIKSKSRYCTMEWAIGDKLDIRITGVCKKAFCMVYGVSSSHVDNVIKDIKNGVQAEERDFTDRSRVPVPIIQKLKRVAKSLGFYLSNRQLAAAKLPNSPTVISAYGWMARFFKMVGDMIPNSDGEIHLEPVQIVEVYGEYNADMVYAGNPMVNVDTFASIWMNCFQSVKIREFKAVSGKCQCCANLSTLRRNFKSQSDREYVTTMHALHRTMYMGERLAYADRRNNAIMEKSSISHAFLMAWLKVIMCFHGLQTK